jgi:hypothetical protein
MVRALPRDPVGAPVGRHVWFFPRSPTTVESTEQSRKEDTMTVTQSWRAARVGSTVERTAVSGSRSRNHRAAVRLWALLNAQALLNGTAGSLDGGALSEDDRWRMAARTAK